MKGEYDSVETWALVRVGSQFTILKASSHTVEVTAASLYEAIAHGLAAFRGNEWIADVGERFGVVKVSVAEVRVEHEVKLKDFTAWLERSGRSPREIIDGQKIRAILGMPVAR